MKWMQFFKSFFETHKRAISRILDARGCREGWLQGQLFLDAQEDSLETNASQWRYDLYSESSPMIAEIKIAGGGYQAKNRGLVKADAEKLSHAPARFKPFGKSLILLVDTRVEDDLARWLLDFSVPSDDFLEIPGKQWVARIWQLKA